MRKIVYSVLGIVFLGIMFQSAVLPVTAAARPVVVVIDPGHGGDNLGTDYLPIPEKDYDLIVALYMKAYLEQYQNVTVYLTRTSDVALSLKERAQFARSVNADFVFSLHFNASVDHSFYGSEVWIPANGTFYSQGYSVANEFLNEFQQMGLYNRGIKTRIGKTGNDYYGIIRQCDLVNIPAVIVEHCHVDHAVDAAYLQSDQYLQEFGMRDARAVAKYFGLTSLDNSTNYSSYAPLAVPVPVSTVYQDMTPPVSVTARLVNYSAASKSATVSLTAVDNESSIQYYAYSLDGGLSWSTLLPWSSANGAMTVTVNNVSSATRSICFKVWNQYDLPTLSNAVAY